MSQYLDGMEALYVLLAGTQAEDTAGNPVTVNVGNADQVLPPAVTALQLPADLSDRIRNDLAVFLLITRSGWSDDQQMVEGQERVTVEVYARTADAVRAISKAIEAFLIDNFHAVPGVGFIDDVLFDTRWRMLQVPTTDYAQSTATYRVVSRPD